MYNLPNYVGSGYIDFDVDIFPEPIQEAILRLASRGHAIGIGERPSIENIEDGGSVQIDYNRDENNINYNVGNWSGGGTGSMGDEVEECFELAGVEVRQRHNGTLGVDITDERYRTDTIDF